MCIIFLGLYLDSISLTLDDTTKIKTLKCYSEKTFKIKDLGGAQYFLWVEILPVKKENGLNTQGVC